MKERSREERLLCSLYYISKYTEVVPEFLSFGEREIFVGFPKTVTDLYHLIDNRGDEMVDITREFEIRFVGFDDRAEYREVVAIPAKGMLDNVKLYPDRKNYVVSELALRIGCKDRDERDNLLAILCNLDFRASRFVIERTPYAEGHFTSDIEGTTYIFLAMDEVSMDNAEDIVFDMSHKQLKRLFSRYFQFESDSLELYYIHEDRVFSMALMAALRESLAENGIRIVRTQNTIELHRDGRKVLLTRESDKFAEKVILSLIFDADGQEAVVEL